MEEKIYNLAKSLFNIGYSKDMLKCIEYAINGLMKTNQITAKEICDLATCYGASKKELINAIYENHKNKGGG